MNMDWMQRAACRGVDTKVFFPSVEAGDSKAYPYRYHYEEALKVCDPCPVKAECRKYVESFERSNRQYLFGVFGNMTPTQRFSQLRKKSA